MYKKVTTTTTEEYGENPMGSHHNPANGAKKYAPCIRVDVPLMIRLLEFAREDASSDMDLHVLTENMIAMSEYGRVLTMNDYEELVEMDEAKEVETNTTS